MGRWTFNKRSHCGIAFLLIVLFPAVPFCATYWIDDNGAATWSNCDGETPLSGASACSIATAMANADDADIVNFRAGTYTAPLVTPDGKGLKSAFYPANSGSAGAYITFTAYDDEVVVIDNSNNANADHTVPSFGAYGQSYIKWIGFDSVAAIDNDGIGKAACASNHSSYIEFRDCELSGGNTGTSNTGSIRLEDVDHITISNCYLYNNGRSGAQSTGVNPSGVEMYSVSDTIIEYCTVYNSVTGFYLKSGDEAVRRITIRYNWIHGSSINGVLENPKWYINQYFEDNVIHHNLIDVITLGIGDVGQSGAYGGKSYRLKIYNNVIRTADQGIVYDPDSPLYSYDTDVYNNIIISYAGSPNREYVRVPTSASMSNPIINDNMYYGSSSANKFEIYTSDYSTIAAWRTGSGSHTVAAGGFDESSSEEDPQFDPDDTVLDYDEPEDVKLGVGSPALSSGRSGADLGIWTTGITQIGYSAVGAPADTTAPTVSSASVNGSTVTINFDETVVTTGYDAADFNIDCSVAGADIALSSPSGSGASRTFTAASAVAYGDTCNLDYVGSTDDIEDAAGNDLSTFSDTAVTNNTPESPTPAARHQGGGLSGGGGTWQ